MRLPFRLFVLICIASPFVANAQYQLGMRNSNFAGVYSTVFNPAHIADSRYLTSFNLLSPSVAAQNNYVQFNTPYNQWKVLFNNLEAQYIDDNGYPLFENSFGQERLNGNKKYAFASAAVMGPSFSLGFNDLSGFAFYNRTRMVAHLSGLNESLMKIYLEDLDTTAPGYSPNQHQTRYVGEDFNQGSFGVGANAFQEYAFAYARVLQSKKHFLKAGVTVKYMVGLGAAYVRIKNLDYNLEQEDSIRFENTDLEYAYISEDFYNRQDPRLNDFFGKSKLGSGLGLDVGVVYEYRPDYRDFSYKMNRKRMEDRSSNKYAYRLAGSITDFGAIRYTRFANIRTVQQGSAGTGYSRFNQALAWNGTSDVDTFMQGLFPGMTADSVFSSRLPTALHLETDYHYRDNWYISASYHQSLRRRSTPGVKAPRVFAVTPRYESKWLTVSMPFSVGNYYHPVHWGLYIGAGFFHIGTDQLGGILTGKRTNGFDLYAGITLPIHHSRLQDRDGDGVDDLTDECPDEFGSYKTDGCPDSDGDKVRDSEDLCPDVPGRRNTKGCPDPDNDFLVLDEDQCPDVYGSKRNNGCPDTDDDGVHDGIDRCPDEFGLEEYEGCPEPIEEKKDTVETPPVVTTPEPDPTPTPKTKTPEPSTPKKDPVVRKSPPSSDEWGRFDFAEYDYYTMLASYSNLDLAKKFQNRLMSEAGLQTTIKQFEGSPYYYITTGKAVNLDQAMMMKESLSTPIVLDLINGRLWWKKIPK
jgi:cell division septation protein DedD